MKKYIYYILMALFSSASVAGIDTEYPEVIDTIKELGVDTDVFSTIWPLYCNPQWSTVIPSKSYPTVKFTKQAIDREFFSTEIDGVNVKFSMGKTCQALRDYYFDNKDSKVIMSFIKKDSAIKKKYNFSSIDLFKYSDNYQGNFTTYNQLPGHKELILKLMNRFKNENIFIVEETIKKKADILKEGKVIEVTVSPYSTFRVIPTDKFKMAHKNLKSYK